MIDAVDHKGPHPDLRECVICPRSLAEAYVTFEGIDGFYCGYCAAKIDEAARIMDVLRGVYGDL